MVSARDRCDETVDRIRSVVKDNYKYIRNFQPFNPDGMMNGYRYKQLAYKEWWELFKENKLNKVQSKFFEPKMPEELYDVENDPYETENYVSNGEIDLIANYDYGLKNKNWGKGKFLIYYMIVHPIAGLTTAGFGKLNGNITPINDSDPIELLRQFWYRHEFFKERLSVMFGITEPTLTFAVNRFAFNDRDKFMMVPLSNIPSKDRIGSAWGGLISFKILPWLSIGTSLNELTEVRKYYSLHRRSCRQTYSRLRSRPAEI